MFPLGKWDIGSYKDVMDVHRSFIRDSPKLETITGLNRWVGKEATAYPYSGISLGEKKEISIQLFRWLSKPASSAAEAIDKITLYWFFIVILVEPIANLGRGNYWKVAFMNDEWCGRAQSTVGSTIPVLVGSWAWVRSKQESKLTSTIPPLFLPLVPTLRSCHDFPQRLTVTWKCKVKQTFYSPKLHLVMIFITS